MKIRLDYLFLGLLFLFLSCSKEGDNILTIRTNIGSIKVKLYDKTSLHRDNFKRLAQEGYYDGLLFHRVISEFVIQAGDPDSRHAKPEMILGSGDAGHVLKEEIRPDFFHRKGVLAAARESDNVNPERNSSGGHFYIVVGKQYTDTSLDSVVCRINERRQQALFEQLKAMHEDEIIRLSSRSDFAGLDTLHRQLSIKSRDLMQKERLTLTEEQRMAYTSVGGIPHLDGLYTIFGEVVDGMDIVDKIAALETDEYNRPHKDVIILKIE